MSICLGAACLKVEEKLPIWKRLYLLKGDRLILIKSTIASIPVFMLSSRLLPSSVSMEIETLVRRFL